MDDFQVIGNGVIVFGFIFMVIGLFTGFNRRFIVVADVLLIIGINFVMGVKQFLSLLITRPKIKGTIASLIGFILVILKFSFLGVLCQILGIYWLFGGFISAILSFLRHVPIIGKIIPGKDDDLII